MKKLLITVGCVLVGLSGFAFGHSGGTDAHGCHVDHSTGLYHCHNPK